MAALQVRYVDWSEGDWSPEWLDWVKVRLAEVGAEFAAARCRTREDLERNAGAADVVVLGGSSGILAPANLSAIPRCFAIVKMGSGVNDLDIPAATERGIVVVNTPQGVTEEVSDHAIAMILASARRLAEQDRLVRGGTWDRRAAWPGRHFRGMTLGLVGLGRIPRAMVRKLSGFEMQAIAHDPYVSAEAAAALGVRLTELDGLLSSADVVSIHCPLTAETRHLIGERELRLMRPEALLVNTARGPIVDEAALYRALAEHWIAGAALDVLEQEPPDPANRLFTLPNVLVTPHLASGGDLFPGELWKAIYESIAGLANHRWPESALNRREVRPRWELR